MKTLDVITCIIAIIIRVAENQRGLQGIRTPLRASSLHVSPKKSHHVRRRPIFHSRSSEEQKKVFVLRWRFVWPNCMSIFLFQARWKILYIATCFSSSLYVKLNILSLDKLILYALAKFMHKYYLKCLPSSFNNYFTLVSSIHSCHTRNAAKSNQYFLPQFSTSLLLRTIKFKGAKLWNDIPENLRKLSHKQFLLKYKAMLLNSSS